MEQSNQNLFDLQIDHQSNSFLSETAKWGKFLAIIGFIFCGLLIVIALFAGTFIASMMSGFGGNDTASAGAAMGGGIITFVYIILALVYFFPCLYLFHFASKMQVALRSNQQDMLNISFRNLKSCFKFMGILMIIMLSFWAIGIIIAIGASVGGGI